MLGGAWNKGSSPCAPLSAIAHYANVTPQKPALIEPNGLTLSYKELLAQIEATSRRLREAGIGPGQKVAVLLPQGVLQVLAVLGVLQEHIAIPLQARTTTSEVDSHLRRLSASALITSQEFMEETESAIQSGIAVLIADKSKSPDEWHIRVPDVARSVSVETTDAILFLITSATTGNSKVVPLTALNVDAGIRSRCDSLQLTDSDCLLLMTSMCHIIGVENALAQFLVGGTVVATTGFDPASYLSWLYNLRPTWYDCSPTVHQAALLQMKSAPLALPVSLRFVQSAGAPLPDEARQGLEQILQVPVFNDYGMTEACPIAVDAFLPGGRVLNSAGRSAGLGIGIMNSLGEIVQAGEEGEIAVRGDAVFSGYYDDPEATRTAFQDGWFRTGDLGRLDRDGNLFVTGRLKEMINRGGEKILPGEVDAVFESHPAVLEAAAFGVSHPTLGEDVACAVVLHPEWIASVTVIELRRFATERLARFKVPHKIYFVEEIPRGELGKPQRWMLTEQLSGSKAASQTLTEFTEQAKLNSILLNLHEIWSRILDCENLSFDADFFEAGGDSLSAINMLAEVDQRYGCQTSAAAASFTDAPTLNHLASLVGQPSLSLPSGSKSSDLQIFTVRETGSSKRLFCLPPDGFEGLYFRRLAKHLSGEMDLAIVRPASTWYSRSLFTFERIGAETAALIRQAQPEGPYFLCGFCFGGLAASEAARQLSIEGQDVRIILFDTAMPGFPGLLRERNVWVDGAMRQWRRLWTSDHPGLTRNLLDLYRRLLWSAVVLIRRFLLPIEGTSLVQRIIRWVELSYYPLYKPRPLDAPLLHFLSADEPTVHDSLDAACRFKWRTIARGGIDEEYLAFDHYNIFHEFNMPKIAEVLKRWCGTRATGGIEIQHQTKLSSR